MAPKLEDFIVSGAPPLGREVLRPATRNWDASGCPYIATAQPKIRRIPDPGSLIPGP